jgi:hypothetical protein
MRLIVAFELDTGLVHPNGNAFIDLDFAVVQSQAVVTVRDIQVESSSLLFDLGSQVFSKSIRDLLAQKLSAAINQALADLPKQEPHIKKIEIVDVQG